MRIGLTALVAAILTGYAVSSAHAQEPSFVDRLELNPDETCSAGAPEAGAVVALALRGARGDNYVRTGNADVPRLAVRGPVTDAFGVLQIIETATDGAVAIYSPAHTRFLMLDENTRVLAQAEPVAAVPFVLEATGDGYFRIRLAGHQVWMRMNVNGYLDFRTRDVNAAAQFCAQSVVSD